MRCEVNLDVGPDRRALRRAGVTVDGPGLRNSGPGSRVGTPCEVNLDVGPERQASHRGGVPGLRHTAGSRSLPLHVGLRNLWPTAKT